MTLRIKAWITQEGLIEQAQEGSHSGSQVGSNLDDLVAKFKAVAQSSHAELFARIVDSFYKQITEEYFAPEDLAELKKASLRSGEGNM